MSGFPSACPGVSSPNGVSLTDCLIASCINLKEKCISVGPSKRRAVCYLSCRSQHRPGKRTRGFSFEGSFGTIT